MRHLTTRPALVILPLILLILISTPVHSQVQSPPKVSIAYSSISSIFAGIWMAKEIGAYEKYGVKADLVYIGAGSIAVQAMVGGDLHMTAAASNAVVSAILSGAPLIAAGSVTNRAATTLWVQPEITRPTDLKGKVLGISRHGSTTHFLTMLVLKQYGLTDQVKMQPLGGAPETDLAFNAGLIAGAIRSIKPGPKAHALADLADLPIPFSMDYLTFKPDFLRSSPKSVEAVLKAYIEGVAALRTQRETAYRMLKKYMRRDDVDDSYQYAVRYLDRVPRVDPATVKTVLDWLGKSDVPVTNFYDNAIMDRLVEQGFIDRLYK